MITINQLVKRFGKVTALSGLSFTIGQGSIFGLTGSNGSGKSTLLRTLAGIYRPDEGSAEVEGESTFENRRVKDMLCFVPDFPYFFRQSTLCDMARLYAGVYPSWDQETFESLCALFPINRKARASQMSKGMQRQAALILALSARPKYLLLDEVFDGLDPVIRQLLKRLLAQEVAEHHTTVVIASHNLRELEDVCDHIGLLHQGGILLERELDSLRLGIHRVQVVFRPTPPEDALAGLDIVRLERRGSLLNLVVRGDRETILQQLNLLEPAFLETLPLTLEEVFINEMEVAGYDIDNMLF